jgi:hypothetical protein
MASNGSHLMVTWIIFKRHLLKVGLTQNRKTMALQTFTTRWFILFYHVWGPTSIEIHWNSIWLRVGSCTTSHYTWRSVTTLHDFGGCVGTAFGHFLLGSHNLMVTALGSCVNWPQVWPKVAHRTVLRGWFESTMHYRSYWKDCFWINHQMILKIVSSPIFYSFLIPT